MRARCKSVRARCVRGVSEMQERGEMQERESEVCARCERDKECEMNVSESEMRSRCAAVLGCSRAQCETGRRPSAERRQVSLYANY